MSPLEGPDAAASAVLLDHGGSTCQQCRAQAVIDQAHLLQRALKVGDLVQPFSQLSKALLCRGLSSTQP